VVGVGVVVEWMVEVEVGFKVNFSLINKDGLTVRKSRYYMGIKTWFENLFKVEENTKQPAQKKTTQKKSTQRKPTQKEISFFDSMVGEKFFLRTVTYHMTGRVSEVMGSIIKFEDAAWIADSGRFMNAIKDGKLSEVEPVGVAYLNMETVVDFFPWVHDLPKTQK